MLCYVTKEWLYKQGCGVGRFSGGVGFLTTLGVGVGFFVHSGSPI